MGGPIAWICLAAEGFPVLLIARQVHCPSMDQSFKPVSGGDFCLSFVAIKVQLLMVSSEQFRGQSVQCIPRSHR